MMEYHVTIEKGSNYQISLSAVRCGSDYSVTICGGSLAHVGAVALGCNEADIKGYEHRGACVSVICAFLHRDDEAARWAAKYLATELHCNVSVSVGIHIDQANAEDINHLLQNVKEACKQFVMESSLEESSFC